MVDVRSVREADWPALWPLLQDMGTDDSEAVARARFHRLRVDPLWRIAVAEVGGSVVGYAAAQDLGSHFSYGDAHRTARFHDLWVASDRRGGGAGRALVAAVTAWAAGRVRYLEWQAHETRSAPFYEHLGFHGEPCPQPEYPTFTVEFSRP